MPTNAIPAGTSNLSTNVPREWVKLLGRAACSEDRSTGDLTRELIELGARVKSAALAAALAATKNRHVACSIAAIFFIGFIEVRSWATGEEAEFRRAKVVRTAKGARRETEVA